MKVELRPWEYECGDGCCTDSGIDVYLDGVKVTEYGGQDHVLIAAILNHFGHVCDIDGYDSNGELSWSSYSSPEKENNNEQNSVECDPLCIDD